MKLDIRQIRQAKGMSQGEAAQIVGLSRPTYATKELHPGTFTIHEWTKLAEALGFDPNIETKEYETCPNCNGTGYVEV